MTIILFPAAPLVFVTPKGARLNPNNVLRNLAVIQRKVNRDAPADEQLPHFDIHDLRHTHTTHLLMAGWSIAVVSRRLEHANPAITEVQSEDVLTSAAFALASAG